MTIRLQACTNLVDPSWIDVSTSTIAGGSCLFSDPDRAAYDHHHYRTVSAE